MAESAEQSTPAPAPPRIGKQGDPCVMVIFGAAGDLTGRMLIPALYNLARAGLLSHDFAVVGVARTQLSNDEFRKKVHDDVKAYCGECVEDELWAWFTSRFYYFTGDFGDDKLYPQLKDYLTKVDQQHSAHQNFFYYLATAPSFFGPIVQKLSAAGLMEQNNSHWRRVVIEKPFGHDLESAKTLNQQLLKEVDENQIYRIDHYLGKETVQNIMAFRFSPTESSSPSGTAATSTTCRFRWRKPWAWKARQLLRPCRRAARHGTQPHHAAHQPHRHGAADFVSTPTRCATSRRRFSTPSSPQAPEDVLTRAVRGQYGEGPKTASALPPIAPSRDVPPDSQTETFVAMKLSIDNWRWADVPFYLRTGKRMPVRNTHIVIQFRRAPFVLFRDTPVEHLMPNQLVLHIQPEEGISLRFGAKVPGPVMRLGTVDMNFEYQEYFGNAAQHRLRASAARLHDRRRKPCFSAPTWSKPAGPWSIRCSICGRRCPPRNFPNYASGTWGPKEADELLERDGRRWRNFEK
jgi:glucose-6-phosphate 1-dehydrogenase